MVHTRGAYECPKGAIDAETFASLDTAAVPPRSDLEENQSAAGGRILRFDHREEKHGNRHASWSAILQFHKGYGARFKTYLRELIRGDVRPYLGHNGEMEPKGLPMTRETMTRVRIAVLIYSMVNAVLFGTGLIFVLTLPVLSAHSGFWISVVVVASLILAAPIAWWIAPRLRARFGKGKAEGTPTAGQM